MQKQTLLTALFDPNDENRIIRCDICDFYLSIGPILYNETVGKICGRCFEKGKTNKFVDLTFTSQRVYEEIAKQLVFPCSFKLKGCSVKLKWNSISQHEDICCFREDQCLFGVNDLAISKENVCNWNGNSTDQIQHLLKMHMEHFKKITEMTGTCSENPKSSVILSQFMDLFFVAVLFVSTDLKNCFFHLLMNGSFIQCKEFTYDLELSNAEEKKAINFPGNKVIPLCNNAFTVNFMEHGLNMDIAALHNLLKSSCFTFCFKIKSNRLDSLNREPKYSLSKNLIFDHKCTACENILLPPIYVCSNSHNSCSACYDDSKKCKCGESITSTRNEVLENMSRLALYNCKNSHHGCTELSNFMQLRFHENNCQFTVKTCIIGCNWTGNNFDMLDHARQKHSPINLKKAHFYSLKPGEKTFCVVLDENIFILLISYKPKDSLHVIVQHIGLDRGNFQFEFSISSGGLKLKSCSFCNPILYGEKVDKPKGIVYPLEFLKQFLTEQNEFFFEIDIFSVSNHRSR